MRKAIVIGSTGMVGAQLIQLLLADENFSEIISLVRRKSGVAHAKLTEHCIDFDKPDTWEKLVQGDVLFSTLGTTLAQAKSKENQFKVDFTYQYNVAQAAAKNKVANYVLVSTAGANEKSAAFYMNMKGQLEKAVELLKFELVSVIQPGPLAGFREKKRFGESVSIRVLILINKMVLLKKYRPIDARIVAQAMINAANKSDSATYTLDKVFELSELNLQF